MLRLGSAVEGHAADRLPHFLFVDDDEQSARIVGRVLRLARPRWVVMCARSAADAARELKEREYDVLITDLDLPDLPGTALLEYTRHRHPRVARVVFSATPTVSRAGRHPELEAAHAILAKPTTPQDLVSTLAVALRTGAGMRAILLPSPLPVTAVTAPGAERRVAPSRTALRAASVDRLEPPVTPLPPSAAASL